MRHCTVRFRTFLLLLSFFSFFWTIVVYLCAHGHRAYFLAFQQCNRCLSIPKMFLFFFSPACWPKNAYGNYHLTTRSHTLRTYLRIELEQTSTRREHEKHNTGTTLRTAKNGFLCTCVQFGQAGDIMQVTRRRSCSLLRLSVPISWCQMVDMYTNSRQATRRG